MRIIDAHIHYTGDHPAALRLLQDLDLKLLNVAVAHEPGEAWRSRVSGYKDLANRYPDRYAWCTTFDPPVFPLDAQAYAGEVIAGLEQDFARGAIACKVWKNIGMDIRKPSGEFILVDDPLFDPIYEYLAGVARPALMHVGEPLACWLPLDDDNPHARYYRANPEWYMADKPDHPSHQALVAARDRVLARHPALKVIGAHLGSLEFDVREIAARLDRYPNFAVDTSARLRDLIQQDPDAVRAFFVQYSDRILFGTDVVQRQPVSGMSDEEREAHLALLAARYTAELTYYRAEGVQEVYGQPTQCLGLPQPVLALVLRENAERWYPGLQAHGLAL